MIEITEEEKYRRKAELLKRALSSADSWDKEVCRRQLRLVVARQTPPKCERDPEDSE